jgi:hypothetical protein
MPGERLFQFMQGKNGAPPQHISWAEFSQMTAQVGWDQQAATQMWHQFDVNKNNLLDQNEFMQFANNPGVIEHVVAMESRLPAAVAVPVAGAGVPAAMMGPSQQIMADGPEALAGFQKLIVSQSRRGWLQEMCLCEAKSEYRIGSQFDNQYTSGMFAIEDSDAMERCCCAQQRSLDITVKKGILDDYRNLGQSGADVISYHRPLRLCPGCCCCQQEIETNYGGKRLGHTTLPWFCCKPKYMVYDGSGQRDFDIRGPLCPCGTVVFKIHKPEDPNPIGYIQKEFGSFGKELLTDADTFVVNFPPGVTAEQKANLLGSTFLIDYNFFENSKQQGSRGI